MSRNSKSELDYLFARLDGMHMRDYERICAKAHLERAYALADLLASARDAIGRLARRVFAPEARFRTRPRQASPWVG